MRPVHEEALRAFQRHTFTTSKIKEWLCWGAKANDCDFCNQAPGDPCLNMNDVKRGRDQADVRYTARPHESRIDWDRIVAGLKQRGYI